LKNWRKRDIKTPDKEPNNKLGFYPSWDTCYRPDLARDKLCDKCKFRKYVYCRESPKYEKLKDEYEER
jgi:hypothetical protein